MKNQKIKPSLIWTLEERLAGMLANHVKDEKEFLAEEDEPEILPFLAYWKNNELDIAIEVTIFVCNE
jgi:hypothetical protein